jgi:pimeloyl-ACP methyl ester carboxylesterase
MPWDEIRTPVAAAGGRGLDVVTAGPADGLPLVFHNGTPAGPVTYAPWVDAAAERGLRTVVYARPGYGTSAPHPGRRVADAAADVAAVLDELHAEQFVTAGWSGGGPHAIACAALLPGRCLGATTIAGVAPYGADGLNFLGGMGKENVAEFGAAIEGEAPLSALLAAEAPQLREITGAQLIAGLGDLASPADQAVMTGEFADYLARLFHSALASGTDGWLEDDLAFVADWGFALGAGAPLSVWQGDQDMMVPFEHGEWLTAHVPGARTHLIPGAGHLSLPLGEFTAILDDLLDMAGVTSAGA